MDGDDPLVGRQHEVAMLAALLDRLPEGPQALLLVGEPGIGKTRLWQAAVESSCGRGYRVFAVRASPAEVQLSFAALGDLLAGASAQERLARLAPAQRRALQAALGLTEAEVAPDPRLIGLAVLAVLRDLAGGAPLVLALDDLQWLDAPSGHALAFALRRIEREPVMLLATVRGEARERLPYELDRVLGERLERLAVGPLTLGALHDILRARFGRSFPRHTLVRIHETSGGNPFYGLELGRALASGDAVLFPGTLAELVSARLARLPARTRETLLALSALSQPTVALARTLAADADLQLERALHAAVIELDGDRIRFAHPLLATGVYVAASPIRRRRLHARLAALVEDAEERARHLALAADRPDAAVAGALEDAAERARARGAIVGAIDLAEQALALTPTAETDDRRRRLLHLADACYEGGDAYRAEALLEEELRACAPGPDRARVLQQLAMVRVETAGFEMGAQLYERALMETGDDWALRAEILKELPLGLAVTRGPDIAERRAREALQLAARVGDPTPIAESIGILAIVRLLAGRRPPAALLRRGVELERASGRVWIEFSPRLALAVWFAHTERFEPARVLLEDLRLEVERRGDPSVAHLLSVHAWLEFLAGAWPRSLALATEAYEVALQSGRHALQGQVLCTRTMVEAHLGDVAAALADGERALALEALAPWWSAEVHGQLGSLALSLDELTAAHSSFEEALSMRPELFPLDLSMWAPSAVETLAAVGELETATVLVRQWGERFRHGWQAAAAARCRGLIAVAVGDMASAREAFEHALELHALSNVGFEEARTLLAFGRLERRAQHKREARRRLEQALEIFERLGASQWAERARSELRRIGGRPAATEALTETERRIAELVAAGRSNAEVAAALHLSPKTIAWNLSKVYRKLGVRSRAALAATLAKPPPQIQ